MLQWLTTAQGIAASILAIVTTLVGVVVAVRKLHKETIVPMKNAVNEAMAAVRSVPDLKSDITKIKAEFRTNSGSTLKDDINTIKKDVCATQGILRARIESAEDIAVYMDAEGEITSVTAGYTELTGLDASSVKHGRWKLSIHPDDIDRVALHWAESLRTGTTYVAEIGYMHVAKGGTVPCKVISSPVIVKDEIIGWAANIKRLDNRVYPPDPDLADALLHIDPASIYRHPPKP